MKQDEKERILKMCHSGVDGMHFGRDKTYKKVRFANVLINVILSAVKAGSVFFWRICTSVVNLAPALRAPLHLSNLNSITSPIIVEAVGVIPCLLRSSREVDCNLRV